MLNRVTQWATIGICLAVWATLGFPRSRLSQPFEFGQYRLVLQHRLFLRSAAHLVRLIG